MYELGNALKQMENDKTPGSDGLTAGFYKVFWDLLKTPYHNALLQSLKNQSLYVSATTGLITLIPKKDRDLFELNNWRPITLLNVDYKIFTKALALRMKNKLAFLIDPDQTGYMQGRDISHNIRRVFDIIQIAKDRNVELVIMSVDYEKCFDRVAHKAIQSALSYFNFGDVFRQYVAISLSNSRLSVINNGFFSPFFNAERGVKQGDCLSPYLALVVMEQLSIRIRNNDKIKGININGHQHKLSQFADDLNLFLKFEKETLIEIAQAFERFERETDFKVNYDKMVIYRTGSLANSDAMIYTGKAFCWTNAAPRILGVTVHARADTDAIYAELITKAEQICKIWSVRKLSLLGKTTIINSLVASLFVYKMQVSLAITKSSIKRFEQLLNNFLWGEGKRAKIKLNTLYNTKPDGGLRLVNLKAKDDTLKIKWVYNCKNDDKIQSLASQFLPSIGIEYWYCNMKPNEVAYYVKPSFWQDVAIAWARFNFHEPRDIEEIIQEPVWFNSFIRVGGKVIFIASAFNAGIRNIANLLNLTSGQFYSYHELTSQFGICLTLLEHNSIISAIPKVWKNKFKDPIIDTGYKLKYDRIVKLPKRKIYDNLVESSGILNSLKNKWETKLGHNIDQNKFQDVFFNIPKLTPNPKFRSFQFRFVHRRIFHNDILHKWKMTDSALCYYCGSDYETIEHLYFQCGITKRFWELLQNWFECATNTEVNLTPLDIAFCLTDDNTLNSILLCAKQFIFKCRIQEKFINFYIFKDELQQLALFEKKWALQKNTKSGWARYNKKWMKVGFARQSLNY